MLERVQFFLIKEQLRQPFRPLDFCSVKDLFPRQLIPRHLGFEFFLLHVRPVCVLHAVDTTCLFPTCCDPSEGAAVACPHLPVPHLPVPRLLVARLLVALHACSTQTSSRRKRDSKDITLACLRSTGRMNHTHAEKHQEGEESRNKELTCHKLSNTMRKFGVQFYFYLLLSKLDHCKIVLSKFLPVATKSVHRPSHLGILLTY